MYFKLQFPESSCSQVKYLLKNCVSVRYKVLKSCRGSLLILCDRSDKYQTQEKAYACTT